MSRRWYAASIRSLAPGASLASAALLAALACAGESPPVPAATVGEHTLAVPGGTIWYTVSGTGGGTPVILLHGGPGFGSFYMKPFEALGDERVVVRYDQLGSGKSGKTTDTALFNIAHFVRELDSLRTALGYDRVALLGHSWGTILAHEYYQAHPEHVASIIFASPALDIPTWEKNARRLVKTLSTQSQAAIARAEATGKFADSSYVKANDEFYGKYVFLRPDKANLDSTFATVNAAMYGYMQGPSEYTITGTLKTYNSTAQLSRIRVPALFMVGSNDEADPPTVKAHAALTPNARFVVIDSAAHMITWDNPVQSQREARAFLRTADSASRAKP